MSQPASPEVIAKALGLASPTPGGYKCRCPAHADKQASLQINIRGSSDGRPTVHCYAGCTSKAIFDAIEAQTNMHFAARETTQSADLKIVVPSPIDWAPVRVNRLSPSKSWKYFDAQGNLIFVVARYDDAGGKTIRPFTVQDVNGQHMWRQGLGGLRQLPLYNLREVLDRPTANVLVVEGEKTADAAKLLPMFAEMAVVSYQGGAQNWKKTDWVPLKGRNVFLWPDNDEAGVVQFYELAKALNLDQFCSRVMVAQIPDGFPVKWDLADDVPEGRSLEQVSWAEAPKAGFEFVMKTITPSNYMEAFDAMYWIYYDGTYRYTISKQVYVYSTGRPFDFYRSLQRINRQHPAHEICMVGKKPAIIEWSDARMQDGTYLSGCLFRPGCKDPIVVENELSYINLFTGWPHTADKFGDCSIIKNHLLHVIANGDQAAYDYVWNYLAHLIQFPEERPTSALVFRGLQGTGKTKLFEIISHLLGGVLGYARKAETMSQITGRFNTILSGSLVVWIEELELTTSRERENRLKTMITDPLVQIEAKGKDSYQDFNFARIMGSTNHEHIWNVVEGERRLSLFEVSEDRKDDVAYFAALTAAIKTPAVMQRFMHELEIHPVDVKLINTSLKNKARALQAVYTSSPNKDLALEWLRSGEIRIQLLDERRDVVGNYYVSNQQWSSGPALIPSRLTAKLLDKRVAEGRYLETNFSARDKRRTVAGLVGMLGANKGEKTGAYEYTTGYVTVLGERQPDNCYKIPSLVEARNAFCAQHGVDYQELFEETQVIQFKKRATGDSDVPF